MKTRVIKIRCHARRGVVLLISLMFLAIFSTIAVSMAAFTGTNIEIAENHHNINVSLAAAESGLEVLRYLLSDLYISSSIPSNERIAALAMELQEKATNVTGSNIIVSYVGSEIIIPQVVLSSQDDQTFSIVIRQIDADILQAEVTGTTGQFSRTVRVNFNFISQGNPIFNYAIASKGSLQMTGNVGVDAAVGSDVYLGSQSQELALTMNGNTSISGNVNINNAYGYASLSGNSSIGGQSGQDAIDNHVFSGVTEVDFPLPDTSTFEQYVQNTIDSTTDTSSDVILDNVRIVAGTNPTFTANTVLRGVIYIETPNIVSFAGNTTITAIIVTNGDTLEPSSQNHISFSGSVQSNSVSLLPDEEQFSGLHDQTGTFLLAPGFSTSFAGNFNTIEGLIAANGVAFSGNAGGTMEGSIISYTDAPITMSGNQNIRLNPSGITQSPAGFSDVKVLAFAPSSYSEVGY